MTVSLILGHPNHSSFNHAIALSVREALEKNNIRVHYHDLYEEGFDPLLPAHEIPKDGDVDNSILNYCDELVQADGIVIVHPNWWGQPPAILKGWIDRVFRPGVAYEFVGPDQGDGVPLGLLKARAALVINTSDTYFDREMAEFGDPLEILWKKCIFGLCGVNRVFRTTFSPVVTSSMSQRKAWLGSAKEMTYNFIRTIETNHKEIIQ